MARTYREVIQDLEARGVQFTGQGKYPNRSTFASRARGWSQETYNKRLQNVVRNQRRRERYDELRDYNLDAKTARKSSGYGRERYQSLLAGLQSGDIRTYLQTSLKRSAGSMPLDDWVHYARLEDYPDDIETNAAMINTMLEYEKGASYAWAFLYYHYVRGYTVDEVYRYLDASPLDGNLYVTNLDRIGALG